MENPQARGKDALPPDLERTLAKIANEHNRILARRYVREKLVNGAKPSTLINIMTDLRALLDALGERDVEASGRDEIAAFLTQPGRGVGGPRTKGTRVRPLAESTRAERAKNVRAFYRWMGKPKAVAWIRPNRKKMPSARPEDILTKEEIARLLDAARTARDRALLALMIESGFRLSEVCSVRVGDVKPTEDGAIRVSLPEADGLKTGRRSVLLFDCAGLVLAWLREHGARSWSENTAQRERWTSVPLFHSWDPDEPLEPGAIYDLVRRTARRAKLEKRVKPHLLRFGAVTHDAKRGMPVSALSKKYGWSDRSSHALYYTRLAASDVEEWERKQRGLLPATSSPDGSLIKPVTCSRCSFQDRPGARFCARCARPLTPDAETEVEARRGEDLRRMIAEEVRRAIAPVSHPDAKLAPASLD